MANKKLKIIFIFCIIGLTAFYGQQAFSGFSEIMNSTNYKISPDSLNSGGGDNQSSAAYSLKDTVGEVATGTSDTTSYYLKAGYRQMADAAVSETAVTATSDNGGPARFDETPPAITILLISKIAVDSEKITWETNEQALCKFYLGKTAFYEIENFEEPTFYYQHEKRLKNLEPGQIYHFKLVCRDTNYNSAETPDYTFVFKEGVEKKTIPNVLNLSSFTEENKIILKWLNPDFPDFSGVRIVRSDKFFPENLSGGEVIYQGPGNNFPDINVKNGKRYYYTVFTYDKLGDYSSGAVITDVPRSPGLPPPPFIIPPSPVPPPPEIEKLTINDFDFFIGAKRIFPSSLGEIYTEPGKPLTFFLKSGKVPEVLKTIMVNLRNGDKFFSFILRLNKEKTGYEATLMSPLDPGIYPLTIDIMNYQNQTLKKIKGEIKTEANAYNAVQGAWNEKQLRPYIYILLGMGLVIIPWIISQERKKRKKKEKKSGILNPKSEINFNNQNINLPGEPQTPQLPAPPRMTDEEGRERKDFPDFKI